MVILIPLSAKKEDGGRLVKIDDAKLWGFFELELGKIQSIKYHEDYKNFIEMIDIVVVTDKHEYIWPFFEESIPVLEAPTQREIDDVIEAFLFKELYEINI